jgi:calcineurin-like phosphoesterase family protein
MNEELIKRWNQTVKDGDTIYHLGDFGFCDLKKTENIRRRLNGNIYFIRGNHDKQIQDAWKGFGWVKDYYEMQIDGIHVILSHYPFLTWNHESRGGIQLSGHTHNHSKIVLPNRKGIHVGQDAWDYYPVSWERIKLLSETIKVDLDFNNL